MKSIRITIEIKDEQESQKSEHSDWQPLDLDAEYEELLAQFAEQAHKDLIRKIEMRRELRCLGR